MRNDMFLDSRQLTGALSRMCQQTPAALTLLCNRPPPATTLQSVEPPSQPWAAASRKTECDDGAPATSGKQVHSGGAPRSMLRCAAAKVHASCRQLARSVCPRRSRA